MKANEAPDKIYRRREGKYIKYYDYKPTKISYNEKEPTEYVCTDAFIEKACEFWKDHLAGYDICEDDIERSVESFKLAMKL